MQSGIKGVSKDRSIPSGIRDGVTQSFSFWPILSRHIMRHRQATKLPDCPELTTFVSACFLPIRWQHWKAQPCLCLQSRDNILHLDCFAFLPEQTRVCLSDFLNQGVWPSPLKNGVTWEKHLSSSPDIHSALSAQVRAVCYIFAGSPVAQDQDTKISPINRMEEASVFWARGR